MPSLKVSVIGLLFLSIILSIYSLSVSKNIRVRTNATASSRPDAFMEGVVATTINQQGHLSLTLETPKMFHYAHNDTMDIETPHVTLYSNSPEPWVIDSLTGQTTQGSDYIVFRGNVVIHHAEDSSHPETFIRTQVLNLSSQDQIATTPEPITLTQPSLTIAGIGLSANLNTGMIHLLSNARGEYVPN